MGQPFLRGYIFGGPASVHLASPVATPACPVGRLGLKFHFHSINKGSGSDSDSGYHSLCCKRYNKTTELQVLKSGRRVLKVVFALPNRWRAFLLNRQREVFKEMVVEN